MGLSYDWTALKNKIDAMLPTGTTNQVPDPSRFTLRVAGDGMDSHLALFNRNGGTNTNGTSGVLSFLHQGPDNSVLALSNAGGLLEGYQYSAFGDVKFYSGAGNLLTSNDTYSNLYGIVLNASSGNTLTSNNTYSNGYGIYSEFGATGNTCNSCKVGYSSSSAAS